MSVPNTTSRRTRTVTLQDGDKFVLPNGATVISVAIDGIASVVSTGCNLPESEQYACFRPIVTGKQTYHHLVK